MARMAVTFNKLFFMSAFRLQSRLAAHIRKICAPPSANWHIELVVHMFPLSYCPL